MRHVPDMDEVRREIRRAIADAFRALASSATCNPATMVTSADLEHAADIIAGLVQPLTAPPSDGEERK
jgi:fructose-1,6-bisphosphatase/inositol monophosphatase family enzyme